MKKFIITSQKFEGGITLVYNEQQLLVKMDIEAELNEMQHLFFFQNLPRNIEQLEYFKSRKTAKVVEVAIEITFDDFYNTFGNKVGKEKALKAWEKLNRAEQIKAYRYIQKYKQSLANGIAQLYPASYLNAKRWND